MRHRMTRVHLHGTHGARNNVEPVVMLAEKPSGRMVSKAFRCCAAMNREKSKGAGRNAIKHRPILPTKTPPKHILIVLHGLVIRRGSDWRRAKKKTSLEKGGRVD